MRIVVILGYGSWLGMTNCVEVSSSPPARESATSRKHILPNAPPFVGCAASLSETQQRQMTSVDVGMDVDSASRPTSTGLGAFLRILT